MARPKGARNIRPTANERKRYFRALKDQAERGNTDAMGWLLLLDSGQPHGKGA